jgi:Pectate lyase superfamily protein
MLCRHKPGDGTTDDAAKIQSAIDYASSIGGGIVQLSDQHAISTALVINADNVTLQGLGNGQTVLSPTAGNTGWVIDVQSATYNGEWGTADTTWSRATDKSRVVIRDLSINGKDRSVAHNGLRITRADGINVQNVAFGYLNGTALQLGGTADNQYVEDSVFDNIDIRLCGNGAGTPALLVTNSNTANAVTGSNGNLFRGLQFENNKGPLQIVNANTNTSTWITDNHFESPRIVADASATYSTVVLQGGVRRTQFSNPSLSGSSGTYDLFETVISGSRFPQSVMLSDVFLHSYSGNGIVATKCRDISITGHLATSGTSTNKAISLPAGSGVEGYKIDVFSNVDPLNATAASSLMNFIEVDSSIAQTGSITINGNCRSNPRTLIQSGTTYPTRGTDEGQTHMFIGSVEPTSGTHGYVLGVDIWVDTSNG